jgi:signal peptidase II
VRRVPLHRLRPTGTPFAIAAAVVVADVATKTWARRALAHGERHLGGPLWLRLSENRGFSFSLGSHWPAVAGVLVLVALAAVTVAAAFARPGFPALGFGLLVGGGFGNLVDRLASSAHVVTDFVAVGSFPVFNLADASITVGLVTLFAVVLRAKTLLVLR